MVKIMDENLSRIKTENENNVFTLKVKLVKVKFLNHSLTTGCPYKHQSYTQL